MTELDRKKYQALAKYFGYTRFRPMQARVGDHAIFFRKAAVEISFEEKRYLVVPQAAILVLVR